MGEELEGESYEFDALYSLIPLLFFGGGLKRGLVRQPPDNKGTQKRASLPILCGSLSKAQRKALIFPLSLSPACRRLFSLPKSLEAQPAATYTLRHIFFPLRHVPTLRALRPEEEK